MKNLLLFFLFINIANARDRIRGIGTPMLFPVVMGIADELRYSKNLPSPFMEVGATGFSFQIFCSGIGDDFPDLVNSSREITQKEIELCKTNNIDFGKINMTFDAIVIVENIEGKIKAITDEDLFNAISAYVFDKNGYLTVNKNRKWNQINPNLPNEKIVFYGTILTSGTYDFLKEKIFLPYCKNAKKDDPLKKYCGLARMDGRYIPVPGGYNTNIQKMSSRPGSVAMVPYMFLEKNYKRVSVISLNGIKPSDSTMNTYLLSRFLYVYYKKNSIGNVAGFEDFINELKKRSVSYDK